MTGRAASGSLAVFERDAVERQCCAGFYRKDAVRAASQRCLVCVKRVDCFLMNRLDRQFFRDDDFAVIVRRRCVGADHAFDKDDCAVFRRGGRLFQSRPRAVSFFYDGIRFLEHERIIRAVRNKAPRLPFRSSGQREVRFIRLRARALNQRHRILRRVAKVRRLHVDVRPAAQC